MRAFLLLPLLVFTCGCWHSSHARINGFYINSESALTCGYPMADIQMDQLDCYYAYSNPSYYSLQAWKNNHDGTEQGEVCYWGQNTVLSGKVTVQEGNYRYFPATIKLCFSSTFCKIVKTKVDLLAYQSDYDQQADEEKQDSITAFRYLYWGDEMCSKDEAASENTYYTNFYKYNCLEYVPAGEYEFRIPLTLPKLTFTQSIDYYEGFTASITMYPKLFWKYNDEVEEEEEEEEQEEQDGNENGDEYENGGEYDYEYSSAYSNKVDVNSMTECSATFQLFEKVYNAEEQDEENYNAQQAAGWIVFVGVLGTLVVKRRRLTTCATECARGTADDDDFDDNDLKQEDGVVSSNFAKM